MARRLVRAALPPTAVRLIGVAYTGLGGQPQEALFGPDGSGGAPDTATGQPDAADGLSTSYDVLATGGTATAAPAPDPAAQSNASAEAAPAGVGTVAVWRPGDDVFHVKHGHGWVQGAGVGRVTVRFETRRTGPGRAITFAAADPELALADPLASLEE